jgi:hypothetical protein
METDTWGAEATTLQEAVPGTAGRPSPIVLTSSTNLIQLQKQLKNVAKDDFEFRNTKNGTRAITKEHDGFRSRQILLFNSTCHFTPFFPKSLKPVKAVLRRLPLNTLAEDISDGLINLGFDVVSVKQMTTRRLSSEGTRNLPLFLITRPRTAKSQAILKLNSLCHISIRVETNRAEWPHALS